MRISRGLKIYVAQRGATGWGFQIGRLYWQINFPRYWFLQGRMMHGGRRASFGHCGWERD